MNRRVATLLVCLALAGCGNLKRRQCVSGPSLQRLSKDVYAWIGAGGDSNAGAVLTKDGLLAIDAQQTPQLGREFRRWIESETGRRATHRQAAVTQKNC